MGLTFETFVKDNLANHGAQHEKPSIILLTCMDYRYAHRIIDVMDSWGLRGKYDVFILAGASAGANQIPEWRNSFVSHIRTARSIEHPISRIVVLEHRDCGAYKKFFSIYWDQITPPREATAHAEQIELFVADMKKEFSKDIPDLSIDAFLLAREQDDELHIENS